MKLVRHAKMTIGSALTKLASVGLIVGIGSIANGAISAPAAQDHEHKPHKIELKELPSDNDEDVEVVVIGKGDPGHQEMLKKLRHNIKIGKLHGDQDEEVEVIIIDEDSSDHKGLLKKLKTEHKIEIKKLLGDHTGNIEVVVAGDEDHGDIEKHIHRHVVDLLHGQGSSKVDYHEMANQLREIADRLDGGHAGKKKHGHHKDIEIHHEGGHGINVFKHAGSDKVDDEDIEIVTGAGKQFHIRKSDQPHQMIIEITPDGNSKAHAQHGDHQKKVWIHRAHDHETARNVFVEKIHTDKKHKHKKRGDATTSDENELTTLKHLRAELDALQDELQKLRSKQPAEQKKKRVRRKKKDLSSADDKKNNRFLWVADDENEKSGNTFVWRTGDSSVEQESPNRFRLELKKKDSDSSDSSSDKE